MGGPVFRVPKSVAIVDTLFCQMMAAHRPPFCPAEKEKQMCKVDPVVRFCSK